VIDTPSVVTTSLRPFRILFGQQKNWQMRLPRAKLLFLIGPFVSFIFIHSIQCTEEGLVSIILKGIVLPNRNVRLRTSAKIASFLTFPTTKT
jgi:hypothetical protein